MDIRNKVFTERAVKHCNRILKEVAKSPSPEVFQRCVGVALREMV